MTDVLSNIFAGLKDQCEKTRLQSAVELHDYISTSFVAMSSDAAASVWEGESGINRRLFDLVHSPSNIENLGGILAIKHLLDVETVQSKRNLFRFYNYLKALLPNNDINVMIAASRTLGQVVKMGGAAFGERFMNYEVPTAVCLLQSTLQSDTIVGRYAGVLILKELARNAPTYFHPHLDLIYNNILDLGIRASSSGKVLRSCSLHAWKLPQKRDDRLRVIIYARLCGRTFIQARRHCEYSLHDLPSSSVSFDIILQLFGHLLVSSLVHQFSLTLQGSHVILSND